MVGADTVRKFIFSTNDPRRPMINFALRKRRIYLLKKLQGLTFSEIPKPFLIQYCFIGTCRNFPMLEAKTSNGSHLDRVRSVTSSSAFNHSRSVSASCLKQRSQVQPLVQPIFVACVSSCILGVFFDVSFLLCKQGVRGSIPLVSILIRN